MLSDKTIKEYLANGKIIIEPIGENVIQPASVDLHIADELLVFKNTGKALIDLAKSTDDFMEKVIIQSDTPFILQPNEFILGSTLETVKLDTDIVARLDGKSSLGRIGLMIHSTAGFVDPGWNGDLTLELLNTSPLPITLYRKMRICQIAFYKLSSEPDIAYGNRKIGSNYQSQKGPTQSRYYVNFENKIFKQKEKNR